MARRIRKVQSTFSLVTLAFHAFCAVNAQVPVNEVTGFNLNPPYFNLAEGSKITATATCGEDDIGRPKTELYCKLVGGPTAGPSSQTIQGQYCDYCNSNDPNRAHPVSNAVDGTERWWQSPPLSRGLRYNEVNVTLDLGQLFHVAYVLIKFANSPRPDLWVLERSVDYGVTYVPWQYFAHLKRDCIEKFGKPPDGRIVRDDDQICTTEYSRIVPLENGEIVVSLVNGRPGAKNFTYSPVLRDFTKATNIRLRFLRTNTLLAHLISKTQRDPTVTRRYYYSLKDISVGGRCMCHGHAQVCGARNPDNPSRLQCECQHNTCGESCDRCCPGFNQKAWRPATPDSANECQRCQCHSHAADCYYDSEVERRGASLNIYGKYEGGGVCINCQHNTVGVNCEHCAAGFYRPYGVPRESPSGCTPCSCDPRTTSGCEDGSGRCICRPNYGGANCERCAEGYYGYPQCIRYPIYPSTTKSPAGHIVDRCPTGYFGPPNCQPCQCHGPGVRNPICDVQTGHCVCRLGFRGKWCDSCAPGYFSYPNCQGCQCDLRGTVPGGCDASGHCLCRPEVEGPRCDHCLPGYQSFPLCEACRCDGVGAADRYCGPQGQCRCHDNYVGPQCDQCAPNHYGYPSCVPCQCSLDGAYGSACDPVSGQCPCLPGVSGQRCDQCVSAQLLFPHCQECQCDMKGTLSGVSGCQQQNSRCHCKPQVFHSSCNTCKEGYFLLQRRNYFGCRGCQCDMGGALGSGCDERSGQCRCRNHVEGRTCTKPETNFYIPDLHHLKYEAEDGSTPNGRPVRFGYDPKDFPGFSWRGYAIMSPAQTEIRVTIHVAETGPSVFRIILSFVNPGNTTVVGRVTAHQVRGREGSEQSKEVMFPPTSQPTFLTVPGGGYAEPFPLAPGKWIVHIQAEGVLLDYLVLLPSSYYEAPVLQERVTEPCLYTNTVGYENRNCLLYKHLPLDGFPSALASLGMSRQLRPQRPTAHHPEMAFVSGRQDGLRLLLRVPEPGQYALVLDYASESTEAQSAALVVTGQAQAQSRGRFNIDSCTYSFLCRSVAVDQSHHVVFLQLDHRSELLLEATMASFLLYKVYAIPKRNFSMEYLESKPMCVSVHGRFTEDSRFCVPSQYDIPPSGLLLDAVRDGHLSVPSGPAQPAGGRRGQEAGPREGLLLKSPQIQISFRSSVPASGRFVFLVHYLQQEHPSFPVAVLVDGGRPWAGSINASFCPRVSGCREVVVAEQRISLDVPRTDLSVTLRVPPGKTLTLNYILVLPDASYSPELVKEKPLNKSSDFINQCGANSFYIDPSSASQFCQESARSLAMFGNDGALPCSCHQTGSSSPTCAPLGGQCQCRPHVIGRECTRCATGYYGFPYCKRCECWQRLCDEVTGLCVCPPQTVLPSCNFCKAHTFGYHPLLGCESCNCSTTGVQRSSDTDCHRTTGQCTCKPRISGRQCDRCAPGYYAFPECKTCKCHLGGVKPDVCHARTGLCLCKKNVVGASCESCRSGSFHFEEANPSGCTSCFCFHATDQCRASDKRRQKFVDMQNWRLQTADHEEVPSVFNPASGTVVADIQELSPDVYVLHWVAPQSYLGDRVSSYGGFLTYQIKTFGIPSEGMVLLDRKPDLQLSGNQMTLVHMDPHTPSPDRLYQGRVQLLEGNFRHSGTSRPVAREELMMVLAGLDGLHIRGLYFRQSQRLSLGQVGLEEASAAGGGGTASHVEVCTCPPEYRGDSCQKCAPGYYRERRGLYLGRCVPCLCNGLSDECEEATGRCLNCRHNTAGDHCERCKEGYYGDAARKTCQVCPCPLDIPTNSFATGCRKVDSRYECACKPGYTGRTCDRCAPGYYGDPMAFEGSCRPCNCNGNAGGCDPRTGVCKNTLEPKDTTTDNQCQECDSCVQTLLNDLEKMDDELLRLKRMLDKANASSAALDRLKKLEDAITAAKGLVDKYNATLENQRSKVKQLEEDVENFNDDINILKEKANSGLLKGEKVLENVEKTNQRAKELLSEVQELLKKIEDLLKDLNGTSGEVPHADLARLLADAERMVRDMKQRNCTGQLEAAVKENEEAENLLNYIKNNVTSQHEANKGAAKRIAGLLKNYEANLRDLEEALQEANDTVKKAKKQNGLNTAALEDILQRIEELNKERAKVTDQISMAKDQLLNTEDLLKMLQDSKKEYEELAAPLDGARTNLTERVNLISRAAAKEDIVRKAEEHAELLNELAKELEEAVRNASKSSGVRDAVDAIDAYRNITRAIQEAEEAAKQAKEAADKALKDVLQQNLTERAKDLKDSSAGLLTEAKDAEKDLKDVADALDDQKKRLNQARKKKDDIAGDLLAAQDELSKIKRDDIGDMIDDAKRTATSANDTANDVLNKLREIQSNMSNITVPSQVSLNGTLDDVDQSVKNLTNTIPSLMDKILWVEELTSNLTVSNVSEDIRRIKELIELARDAANRVIVPMRFTGNSRVELRAPTDLADLRAFTSLSLSLQRPLNERGDLRRRRRQAVDIGDMFVLYLGSKNISKDYIGMYLIGNQLSYIYQLNGKSYGDTTLTLTGSLPQDSVFDRVDLRRMYEDIAVTLTKAYTSQNASAPYTSMSSGDPLFNLLNVDPSDLVFYVGGFPKDFIPPDILNLPGYQGCIEFATFNERFVSLYNFKEAVNVNRETPCRRRAGSPQERYFEGTGYAAVDISDKSAGKLRLGQYINSTSENAQLMYVGNEDFFYSISVERGYSVFRGHDSGKDLETMRSPNKVSLDGNTEIFFIIDPMKKSIIRVGSEVMLVQLHPGTFQTYYIGGLPTWLRERDNITAPPLKGCMTNFKMDGNSRVLSEEVGVSRGCPVDFLVTRDVELGSGGVLTSPLPGFKPADGKAVSIGFRSVAPNGIILRNTQEPDAIELSLSEGFVLLKSRNQQWKSQNTYNDGRWHYVTALILKNSMVLRVDEDDEGLPLGVMSSPVQTTGGNVTLGSDTFSGCLTNLYTRRDSNRFKAEDLSGFYSTGDVLLDVCSDYESPQLMLAGRVTSPSTTVAGDETPSGCRRPTALQHSFQLGGPTSFLSYRPSPQLLQDGLHFSLDVRTRSQSGMLLYINGAPGSPHLALYVHRGRIRVAIGGGHVLHKEKFNNGKWHTVMFSWQKRRFRLVVDGLHAKEVVLTPREGIPHLQGPVYLGSVPASLPVDHQWKTLPTESMIGCIRNFKLNGQPLPKPSVNHGVAPCFDGPVESGAYFSGQRSYIVIDDSFVVGFSFELVFEIRPRSLTGLLFFVGGSQGHHLSLFMKKGEVVVQVDNGAGPFSVSVTPQEPLCDDMFHRVAVIKRNNVVQLDVDTEGQYTVGPSSSSFTNTSDPLYVGGIPETLLHPDLLTTPYVGCLQKVWVNGKRIAFDKVSKVSGPVNLRECPAG